MPDMKKTTIFTMFLRFVTLFYLVLVSVAPSVQAQQPAPPLVASVPQDIYRVEGVKISLGGNTATARDRAVEQAQQEAFQTLIGRLTVAGGQQNTPSPSDMAKMVQDIDIVDEKVSATRYSATYNIRFRPEATRAFLSGKNLAVAEIARAPMLVVPIWIVEGRQKLWDVDNPWRDAWRQQAARDPLLPMIVPEGTVEDIALGTADELIAGKPEVIAAFQAKYKTDTMLVAVATQRPEDRRLGLEVRDYGHMAQAAGLADAQKMTLPPMVDETDAALYVRGVQAVKDRLRDQWKQQTAINLDAGQSGILVSVPVRGIDDWIAVQQRLNQRKNVLRADVLALNTSAVRLMIYHYGTIDQLRVLLEQQGLVLAAAPDRVQPVLIQAAGTAPAPQIAPQPNGNDPAIMVPGARAAPAITAEPEWVLSVKERTP